MGAGGRELSKCSRRETMGVGGLMYREVTSMVSILLLQGEGVQRDRIIF